METEKLLGEIKNKINQELEVFFGCKIKMIKEKSKPKEFLEMAEKIKKFVLNSGKRIRPILLYYGYLAAGGKETDKIVKAAISIELIHSYLLIHDDIIDRDNFRHGDLSMHYKYNKEYSELYGRNDLSHFGNSMGIMAGDLAAAFGYEIMSNSEFAPELKIKAINRMNQIFANTIAGESLDVVLGIKKEFSIDDIYQMQKYKTAKYSIEGPLQLGAILARASGVFVNSLKEFAIPLGIAYQIQDDIIGVFGDEKKTGKPVGADIREGKKTLLIAKALELADDKRKKILNSALGNVNVSEAEIKKVRKIIVSSGSLKFSENKADELVKISLKYINEMAIEKKHKELFLNLVDFMVKRKY